MQKREKKIFSDEMNIFILTHFTVSTFFQFFPLLVYVLLVYVYDTGGGRRDEKKFLIQFPDRCEIKVLGLKFDKFLMEFY